MLTDLTLNPWSISCDSKSWDDEFPESIFFTGNGRMGVRGYLPFEDNSRGIQKGLYLAGIFGEIKPGITDLVNLPTPVFENLTINGERTTLKDSLKRVLDLKSCTLVSEFTLVSVSGINAHIRYERLFPYDSPALMLQKITISTDKEAKLRLISGISSASCNSPVPDDQTKQNTEIVFLAKPINISYENGLKVDFSITGTGLTVTEKVNFLADKGSSKPFVKDNSTENLEAWGYEFDADVAANEIFTLKKITEIITSRDIDPRIKPLSASVSYEDLEYENKASWNKIWSKCDFTLPDITSRISALPSSLANTTTEELQCALRFNMLGLITSCSRNDSSVSIGARGLTHGRYKGCYFWDTDVFMLPFFLQNDRQAAKSLLEYRIKMLPAAKKHSEKMNTKGARYPWMSALDGSEQCESWDIGCSELHITADIPYAMDCYCKAFRDDSFYLDEAAEVYVETARFWASRYTWNSDHTKADLLFCKGPDEYCGITNNNLFTNVMVQLNLELAIKAAKDLKQSRPAIYERLGISEEEIKGFTELHDAIRRPYDPVTGHLATDETFHLLEPVNLSEVKLDDGASYHNICFDRLQRYKVVKQADVLLIMTRLPERFTQDEKETAWKDFEPICLHDSTLSFASHALFALQNGIMDKGIEYLVKALLLDVRDIMGNTGHEGLHLASMGEAWQAARCLLDYK